MTTISKVYTSRNHLLEILAYRGFDVSEYDGYSIAHVGAMLETGQLNLLLTSKDGKKIYVKYCLDAKPKLLALVDEFFPSILRLEDDLMLIVKDELNDSTREILESLWTRGIFVSWVTIKRLQFNILQHTLVPPHVILNADETTEVLSKYRVSIAQLPEIGRFDPVAVVLGMRPGMVCRIERSSKSAMHSNYYRACV